jgi:hypothetical protein
VKPGKLEVRQVMADRTAHDARSSVEQVLNEGQKEWRMPPREVGMAKAQFQRPSDSLRRPK